MERSPISDILPTSNAMNTRGPGGGNREVDLVMTPVVNKCCHRSILVLP